MHQQEANCAVCEQQVMSTREHCQPGWLSRWQEAWRRRKQRQAHSCRACWCSRVASTPWWLPKTCPPSPACTRAASCSVKSSPCASPSQRCVCCCDARVYLCGKFLIQLRVNSDMLAVLRGICSSHLALRNVLQGLAISAHIV